MIWVLCCACRVPVTTKLDPIIAITCVAHSSVDITAKPSAGGVAPELGDIQALDSQGEEEGMDEGLGGISPGEQRAVVFACGSLGVVGLMTVYCKSLLLNFICLMGLCQQHACVCLSCIQLSKGLESRAVCL